jgi:hypothetical protein
MSHIPRGSRTARVTLLLAAAVAAWSAVSARQAAPANDAARVALGRCARLEQERVLPAAAAFLVERPVTVTAARAPRSAGGVHDFFSEGDYWWPDPANPEGPYIQRDGLTNPANFVEHRRAMVRLGTIVPTLTTAYLATGDRKYADGALVHLRAWFIDPATHMNPSLLYAQAIKGRATGRGIGIIDTVHLVEVARSAEFLLRSTSATPADAAGVRGWFTDYLAWLTTHEYGLQERDAKNNHGTCWVMQVAAFAHLTGRRAVLDDCRRRFKEVLVKEQMAADGSFPLELKRTKPYGYSIFNLDAFATICQILSTRDDDLWTWQASDGRGMRKALAYLFPYLKDRTGWPGGRDVMYFDAWPVRQPSLIFGGVAYSEPAYLELWASLNGSPTLEEVIRNLPVRHPLLWLDRAAERERR